MTLLLIICVLSSHWVLWLEWIMICFVRLKTMAMGMCIHWCACFYFLILYSAVLQNKHIYNLFYSVRAALLIDLWVNMHWKTEILFIFCKILILIFVSQHFYCVWISLFLILWTCLVGLCYTKSSARQDKCNGQLQKHMSKSHSLWISVSICCYKYYEHCCRLIVNNKCI